jgi:hypothetical protein
MDRSIAAMLAGIPLTDAHTHLTGGRLAARGLHDVLLYHMVISELYSAGCPSGARLTEWPGTPSDEEAHDRLVEAIPFLPYTRNTSCSWLLRTILRDLYGWTEPVTLGNWRRLDAQIRERRDDRGWQRHIIERSGVWRLTTELSRAAEIDSDILDYSLEWAFFTRTQRGMYDNPLYELERTWGQPPGTPVAHGVDHRAPPARTIRSLADVHEAMDHFLGVLASCPVLSLATHVSTDLSLVPVSDDEMAVALEEREHAGPRHQDVYASYLNDLLLDGLARLPRRVAFQFSFGAEPLPHETASLMPQSSIAGLARTIARHPDVTFVCLVASRHANQSLATLARELPNLTLAGYWWHNFFPGVIRQVVDERLDMLPGNRQIGFFSDAYSIEWTYAKAVMVREVFARALASRVDSGQLTRDDAQAVARQVLTDTAREVLHTGDGVAGPA